MLLLAALLSPSAEAAPILTGELQTTAPLHDDAPTALGTGLGVRLGFPIDAVAIRIVPEGGATLWSGDAGVVPYAGARVAIGKLLEPGAYAHALFPLQGSPIGYDAGAFLDVTAIPKLAIGLNLGVVDLGAPSLAGGVHVGLKF